MFAQRSKSTIILSQYILFEYIQTLDFLIFYFDEALRRQVCENVLLNAEAKQIVRSVTFQRITLMNLCDLVICLKSRL